MTVEVIQLQPRTSVTPSTPEITRLAAPGSFGNANISSSQNVTVETGCDLFILGVSGYIDLLAPDNAFSGGAITLNGIAPTGICPGDMLGAASFLGSLFYWISPASGLQSLAWTWQGTAVSDGVLFVFASYQGVDTITPERTQDSVQASFELRGLASQNGDFLISWADAFNGGVFTWFNPFRVNDFAFGNASGSLAERPAMGVENVFTDPAGTVVDGAFMVIAFIPAS